MIGDGNPALSLDPFPWYRAMREGQPVFRDPRDGAWHVFRYGDVQRVLAEHAAFSSDSAGDGGRGRTGRSRPAWSPPTRRATGSCAPWSARRSRRARSPRWSRGSRASRATCWTGRPRRDGWT